MHVIQWLFRTEILILGLSLEIGRHVLQYSETPMLLCSQEISTNKNVDNYHGQHWKIAKQNEAICKTWVVISEFAEVKMIENTGRKIFHAFHPTLRRFNQYFFWPIKEKTMRNDPAILSINSYEYQKKEKILPESKIEKKTTFEILSSYTLKTFKFIQI